jgi:sugar lactone lactonase YvrE
VWHAGEQALYWTDINRFLIHRFDPPTRAVQSWFFEEPVTALALTDREGILAAVLGSSIILWKPASDERVDHGFHLDGWPAVRFNDARPDPRGSLWAGTMRNNVLPDGSSGEAGGTDGVLYRIDPDGAVSEWKRDIGISNTVAWSPDRTRFYFADSLANAVRVYEYDEHTGSISGECPFFAGFGRGVPDGSTVDSAGFLWNCRWGGSCIVRLAPDGSVDCIVEMPVTNITSCTFGGADLRTLYVTTASAGTPPGERLAGSLFAIRTEVAGLPENVFHLAQDSQQDD